MGIVWVGETGVYLCSLPARQLMGASPPGPLARMGPTLACRLGWGGSVSCGKDILFPLCPKTDSRKEEEEGEEGKGGAGSVINNELSIKVAITAIKQPADINPLLRCCHPIKGWELL